jgi:hypothetical protein
MKIGINLAGVSYDDGSIYRYRNFEDALDGFHKFIVNPLLEEGHEIEFYLYTYDSPKKDLVLKSYSPIKNYKFVENKIIYSLPGRIPLPSDITIMAATYIRSLEEIVNADLDLVISTRFDISFLKNPFKEYAYDFTKCNFLWREPEFTQVPIVSDTFIVFPHHMTYNLINTILELTTNPPSGVRSAMHNLYIPMCNQVGKENVKIVCEDFNRSDINDLYVLTRKV